MRDTPATELPPDELQRRLDELRWYHTIDVTPRVSTKGWFDLRHALDLIPFPEVQGKRCLDIGTWDGFYAYELERRGASEVVAIDVVDLTSLDYPPDVRADPTFDPSLPGTQPRSAGFRLLHQLLDSKVQWRGGNIYDVDPDEFGTFDLVVVGSLLVHLRDPVRALEAVRRVTRGALLSIDYVHPPVNFLARRRPLFELRGESADFQWWLASDAGLRRLLHIAGFKVEEVSKYFLLRPGASSGPPVHAGGVLVGARRLAKRGLNKALSGDDANGGHLHRAYLVQPRF